MEKFINESTIRSASEYPYPHPDAESSLSPNLPEPMLSNLVLREWVNSTFRTGR